jgi:Uma2 family endonuclease
MSPVPLVECVEANGYPTTDPKYMSESELHRLLRNALIDTLQAFYADEPLVHVTGDVLLFYEKGNRRKHLAPDLFVAFGVGKQIRDNYLMWDEAPPSVVIELTSPTTRDDDIGPKFALYRDVLKVKEYFLFDPKGDLITPSMQGWRLVKGVYRAIREVVGRLPSRELCLHLEREGNRAYLWNPETGQRLLSPSQQAEQAREEAEQAREEAEQAREEAEQAREEAEAENARLRLLLEQAGIRFDERP